MKSKKSAIKSKKTEKKSKLKEVSAKNQKSARKKVPPQVAHKKFRLPIRQRREPFKSLMILRRQTTVSADKAYAFLVRKLGGEHKGFVKIDLPGELVDNPAHKVGMPYRYSTTLFGPPPKPKAAQIYYLYNTYNFMDDLTKYDIYRRAAHYSAVISKRKRLSDEFKLAGMAVCATFDVKRRREKLVLRGRWRPEYSNYGRRMLESPRSLTTKLQKYGQPFFSQIIMSKKVEAKAMTNLLVHNLKQNLETKPKETKGKVLKFLRHNHDWMKDRMKCCQTPIFLKVNRDKLCSTIVNRHHKMPYRKRGDQDLFSEFNYLSSHFAFSVHFCRVVRGFSVNLVKEDEVIQKTTKLVPLIRVRTSRYTNFPAVSVVKYTENDELQMALPRIPKKAPSIAAVSGYSSDSSISVATNTPLDWELDWKNTDKELEHRMNFLGDSTRYTVKQAADRQFNGRKWREMERRKQLLYKEDGRFELQETVPIFKELTKMHPPLIYCKLKGMELNKLRRSKFPEDSDILPDIRHATAYLFKQRINFLEKTLPCKDDPRILLTPGWRVFATREDPENFRHVARILRQRSAWVTKNCMARSVTVPRCDKLPMNVEGRHKKLFLVLILLLTLGLIITTLAMISFI